MKIGVIGKVRASARERLAQYSGVNIVEVADGSEDLIAPAVIGADALLLRTSKLSAGLLDQAPNLKVVSRHGVGYDNVPVEYLNRRQIPIAVSATANRVSVAEHAMAMMLYLAKDLGSTDHGVRRDDWGVRNRLQLFELMGKTLLIVGFGRIGRETAQRARAFGMNVLVYDPFVGDDPIETMGCERCAVLEQDVGTADIVTLHLPLNADTRNLFDADMLARMKQDALLINTARGGIVNETDLAQALRNGQLAGAGLDVLEQEPPASGHPLYACRNLVLSPHVAGVTQQSLERMGMEAAANIIDVLDGKFDPAVIVNFEHIAHQS